MAKLNFQHHYFWIRIRFQRHVILQKYNKMNYKKIGIVLSMLKTVELLNIFVEAVILSSWSFDE